MSQPKIDEDMLWETTDGRKIRFRDLDDIHLLNVIYLLKRRLTRLLDNKDMSQSVATERTREMLHVTKKVADKRGFDISRLPSKQIPYRKSDGKYYVFDHNSSRDVESVEKPSWDELDRYKKRCECGARAVGLLHHASYCPASSRR